MNDKRLLNHRDKKEGNQMKKLLLMLVLIVVVVCCAMMFYEFTQTDIVQDFLYRRITVNYSN